MFSSICRCDITQYNKDQSKPKVMKNRQRWWSGLESMPTPPDPSDPEIPTEIHLIFMFKYITTVTLQSLESIDGGDRVGDNNLTKDNGEVTKRDPIRQTPFGQQNWLAHVATFCHICWNTAHSSTCQTWLVLLARDRVSASSHVPKKEGAKNITFFLSLQNGRPRTAFELSKLYS